MKQQFEKLVGQALTLHTDKGMVVGILQEVTDEGLILKPLPTKDAKGLDVEHVYFGGGFYPWRGFGYGGYPGYGFGYPGFGYGGLGVGVGVGVGVGAGFGFGGPGLFW